MPSTIMDKSGIILSGLVLTMLVIVLTLLLTVSGRPVTTGNYLQARQQLLLDDRQTGLGANITLTPQEKIVNQIILKEKMLLVDKSLSNGSVYIPSLSFFKSKPFMEKLPLFKIVQSMPKGGVLHIHDLAAGTLDWLISNATYREHVHMCFSKEGYLLLAVFTVPPTQSDCSWKLVETERKSFGDRAQFDKMLKQNISFLATDPETDYVDDDKAWVRFQKYFSQVFSLIFYIPVFKDYMKHALENMYADNCQYMEYRGGLQGLFNLDGKPQSAEFGLLMLQDVITDFTRDHPDFVGGKVIWTGSRAASQEEILEQVKMAVELRRKYPNFFLGYDLVGDEVLNPLINYLDALLYPSRLSPPFKLPYYFHAGETDWQNTAVDYNLVDALLLNTTRIGHGYALTKHPHLAQIARSKGVAVEVNPISNQVLRLVSDLRNHPMTSLMASGYPVVISSDDPGAWEALPLSHDFFLALTAMSGRNTGLAFLKQLAMNSILYSGMNSVEKNQAFKLWQSKWDVFIQDMIRQHSASHPLLFRGRGV